MLKMLASDILISITKSMLLITATNLVQGIRVNKKPITLLAIVVIFFRAAVR